MICNKSVNLLVQAAENYRRLGYTVGQSKGKELITEYFQARLDPALWNSISIILDGLVCVDFDKFVSLDPMKYPLPPTLKERSRRGLHYYYRLPLRFRGLCNIGWKKHIDLLTKGNRPVAYHKRDEQWQGHVVCSPSKGYSRLFPITVPAKNELPPAPRWILDYIGE